MKFDEIESLVIHKISRRLFNEADILSRRYAKRVFEKEVSKLSEEEVFSLMDKITGGLGYRKGDFNIIRISYCGSLIAWPEVVKVNAKVLEIGTGIGRTCYAVVAWSKPSLYLTIDISPEIIAIALYRNPVEAYRRALMNPCVKICLCDAIKAISVLPSGFFDHVIHDGGPNPNRNPSLYAYSFIRRLVNLIKNNGTISIFAGKNKYWQEKIYKILKSLKLKVESVAFPDSPVLVFHACKS